MKREICLLVLVAVLGFGAMAGCGLVDHVDGAVCYVHPEYGQVCVEYDGKFHLRADLKGDELLKVVDWLRTKGVDVE